MLRVHNAPAVVSDEGEADTKFDLQNQRVIRADIERTLPHNPKCASALRSPAKFKFAREIAFCVVFC